MAKHKKPKVHASGIVKVMRSHTSHRSMARHECFHKNIADEYAGFPAIAEDHEKVAKAWAHRKHEYQKEINAGVIEMLAPYH